MANLYTVRSLESQLDLRLTLSVDQFLQVYPMILKLTLNCAELSEVKYWLPTLKQKWVTEKRLIFTDQKISLLALHLQKKFSTR
jgi:hypothetical protein